MSTLKTNDQTFDKDISTNDVPVVVDLVQNGAVHVKYLTQF